MSLSWLKEIQQVPIMKSVSLPALKDVTKSWTSGLLPKRDSLLEVFTHPRDRVLISKIAVKAKTEDGKIYFKVVVLKHFLNLANKNDLDKFKQILLSLNLENIHFINSEYSDKLRETSTSFADLRNMSVENVRNSDEETHHILKCEHDEMDEIIEHLLGTPKKDVTDDEMAKVNSFIEYGFQLKPTGDTYAALLKTHNLTKEWFRKEKVIIDDETFLKRVENCFETLYQEGDGINVSQHRYMIAHALLECKKTKEAQQVKEPHKKKKKAFNEWKNIYQGKTKKERKSLKITQRSIAKDVGISVATLNNWIKEFKEN